MDESDVRFTEYVKTLMRQRGLTDDDEMLIAAIIQSEPLTSRAIFNECSALRAIEYFGIEDGRKHDIVFVYLPNSDLQLHGRDTSIVVHCADTESFSGHGFESESIVRIIEVIAELTRYVTG
jgi:hypothetical protein